MSEEPPTKETATAENEITDNVVSVNFKAPTKSKRPPLSEKERRRNREKLDVFKQLVEQGMVMVVMDSRRKGVQVPPRFSEDHQLRLNFSLKFYIEDFEYDDYGVRASLSFNKVPYFCDIPWDAVYALNSQAVEQGVMWPDDVPTELQNMVEEIQSEQQRIELAKSFKTYEGSGEGAPVEEEVSEEMPARPALRLVTVDEHDS